MPQTRAAPTSARNVAIPLVALARVGVALAGAVDGRRPDHQAGGRRDHESEKRPANETADRFQARGEEEHDDRHVQETPPVQPAHEERAEDLVGVVQRPIRLGRTALVAAQGIFAQLGESRREKASPVLQRTTVRAAAARAQLRADLRRLHETEEGDTEQGEREQDPPIAVPSQEKRNGPEQGERASDDIAPGAGRDVDERELMRDVRAALGATAAAARRAAQDQPQRQHRRQRDDRSRRRNQAGQRHVDDPLDMRAHTTNIGRLAEGLRSRSRDSTGGTKPRSSAVGTYGHDASLDRGMASGSRFRQNVHIGTLGGRGNRWLRHTSRRASSPRWN